MEKPASQIFAEFEENYDPETIDYADVKYHLELYKGAHRKRRVRSNYL